MTQNNQPDWNAMAEKFDLWVPFIKPVGDKMLAAIKINEGDYVLDVASGTGEPALSLAQEMQNKIRLIGTDAMEGMVKVAQTKAQKQGFDHVEFKTMPAEHLEFENNTFDNIICRFGVMLFQDPQQGLKEMYRVLKPGGHFVLAVWNTPETMPIMNCGTNKETILIDLQREGPLFYHSLETLSLFYCLNAGMLRQQLHLRSPA